MCGRGGYLAKLNFMNIKKILDRRQALNKKGLLTDGEIKSLVKEWHDKRTEAELNHGTVEMEMKAMEKKVEQVQRGAAWGATHRTRRWYNEGVGQSNGGMRIDGDQGDKNGGHRKATGHTTSIFAHSWN